MSTSVLISSAGTLVFASKTYATADFRPGEVEAEIDRISRNHHSRPRLNRLPSDGPDEAVIATWGAVALAPVDARTRATLAGGSPVSSGILIDFLGNVRESARRDLPVFRLAGGSGYFWIARTGRDGHGALRFGMSDVAAFDGASVGPGSVEVAGGLGRLRAGEAPVGAPAFQGLPDSQAPTVAAARDATPGAGAATKPAVDQLALSPAGSQPKIGLSPVDAALARSAADKINEEIKGYLAQPSDAAVLVQEFPQFSDWLADQTSQGWSPKDVMFEVADYGSVDWKGRSLPVPMTMATFKLVNTARGTTKAACFTFGRIDDVEFNAARDPIAVECSDAEALNHWRTAHAFTSRRIPD